MPAPSPHGLPASAGGGLFQALWRLSDEACLLIGRDGLIRAANSAAMETFGRREDRLVGAHWQDLCASTLPEADYIQGRMAEALSGADLQFDLWINTGVGRAFAAARVAAVDADGETVLVARVRSLSGELRESHEVAAMMRSQREWLSRALEAGQLGTWEWNLLQGTVRWSESMYEIFGVAPGEFAGTIEAMHGLVAPEHLLQIIEDTSQAVSHRSRMESMVRLGDHVPEPRHVVLKGQVHYDSGNNPVLVTGLAQDITDRRAENEQKRRIEERLTTAIQGVGDYAIFTLDAWGSVETWNPGAERITGFGPEEILGQSHHLLGIHPEKEGAEYDGEEPGDELLFAETMGRHETEGLCRRRDGSTWWAHILTVPLKDRENGTLFGFAKIIQDRTERRRQEEEIRRANEELSRAHAMLQTVIESSPLAIAALDSAGRVEIWNPALEQLLGYAAEEVSGKPLSGFIDESRAQQLLEEVHSATKDALSGVETQLFHKTGDARQVSVHATHLPAAEGDEPGLLALIQDITERKRAEAMDSRLRQSEKMVAVAEMSATVAHEVSNPMGSIVTLAHLLLETPGAIVDEHARENVVMIRQEAERATGILQRMLRLARRRDSQKASISLNERMDYVLQARAYPMRNANIRIHREMDPVLPPITGDKELIEGMLLNLVVNAEHVLRPMGEGDIWVESHMEDEYAVLSITDSGAGIPEDVLPNIFKPFFSTKAEGEGTGLGLSVSYGVVKEHGGSIRADNVEGRGARFTIRLPLALQDASGTLARSLDQARDETELPAANAEASSTRVLIADDESIFRTAIGQYLVQRGGYEVMQVDDGTEVLSAIEYADYDVLVLDVWMLVMPAPELWEHLSEEQRRRVVFMTGDSMGPQTRPFLESTGRPFVPKPFDPPQMERIIGKVAAQTRKRRASV